MIPLNDLPLQKVKFFWVRHLSDYEVAAARGLDWPGLRSILWSAPGVFCGILAFSS